MIKTVLKLVVAALVIHGAWRLGAAYFAHYQFEDAVTQAAQFGAKRSVAELEQEVLDLASDYDIPIDEGSFTVSRNERNHTLIDGAYTRPVEIVPGYRYPWSFSWHVDVITMGSLK